MAMSALAIGLETAMASADIALVCGQTFWWDAIIDYYVNGVLVHKHFIFVLSLPLII